MNNRLQTIDDVRVEINDINGKTVSDYQGSGYHNVEEAVMAAYEGGPANLLDIRDYTFTVRNLSTGTMGRYRMNAHAHLKILPEE